MTQYDTESPMRDSVANRLAASLRDMNDEMLARGADYSNVLLDAARELERRRPTLTDEERRAIEELRILAREHRPNSDRVKVCSYTVERFLRRTK